MSECQSEILSQEFQNDLEQMIDLDIYHDILVSEDTLLMDDVMQNQPISILSNEDYSGPFNFEVSIIPSVSKNPWEYSADLNKMYIKIRCPFPVDFQVKSRPPYPLFIRITPIYSSPQFAQEPVYRCRNHEHSDGNADQSNPTRAHIVRCNNPLTMYMGEKDKKERLSLVIPLSHPQPGTETVKEMFEFMCTNSCPMPGMNRRATEIIFTLEDGEGNILGRKALNFRICSCPKRDKEKDEKDGKPPPGKKRKLMEKKSGKKIAAPPDTQETTITIPVVGKGMGDQILKYCQDLYSGEILRIGNDAEATPYVEVLNKINAMIKARSE